MPKVSVIIAVYNAAKYIERCARSLFEQSLQEMEFIFVNDCSPDDSFEILARTTKDYPSRTQQIKIIHHKQNLGVAAARTSGMKAAKGEYITHCDPDDWIETDAYLCAYTAATAKNADILTFGHREIRNDGTETVRATASGCGIDILRKWNFSTVLWNSIVRREIIQDNDIYPFPGINSGEDTNTMIRAYLFASNVVCLDKIFYNYNCLNSTSITSIDYKTNLERYLKPNVEALEKWFILNKQPIEIIYTLKAAVKGDILLRKDVRDAKLAIKTWPEANLFWSKLKWYSPITRLAIRAGILFPPILSLFCTIQSKLR